MAGTIDTSEALGLAPDPHDASCERWLGSLPAHVDWMRMEDRLVARGWYPKNAIPRLRVYGFEGGHEVVIEPAARRLVLRLHPTAAMHARAELAQTLAGEVAQAALAPAA
jgi:hypothetical protein